MRKVISLFTLILITRIALPCSCLPYEINYFKNVSKRLINCMVVFDTMDYSFEYQGLHAQTGYFVLLDTINGIESEIGDTIIITGQNGLNCGESIIRFSHGDTLFLAISKGYDHIFGKDTFYLNGCNRYFLKIENGKNNGLTIPQIKDKIETVLTRTEVRCECNDIWQRNVYDFYNNLSTQMSNCLAVFQKYDYSYEYDGLKSQTGHFVLIDTIGDFITQIGDTILITGGDGINCGQLFNDFSPGDTMFLNLNDGYYESFKNDTFYLKGGACGFYYLKIENGHNNGLSINLIKSKINSIITTVKENFSNETFTIYPNPADDKIFINSECRKIKKVEVYNISGQLIKTIEELDEFHIEVDLLDIESGFYNIRIFTDKSDLNYRFIKN